MKTIYDLLSFDEGRGQRGHKIRPPSMTFAEKYLHTSSDSAAHSSWPVCDLIQNRKFAPFRGKAFSKTRRKQENCFKQPSCKPISRLYLSGYRSGFLLYGISDGRVQ